MVSEAARDIMSVLGVWWCTLLDERLPAAQITQAAS